MRDGESIPRKQIANDMKHNPKKDIIYDFKKTGEVINHSGNRTEHITYMKHSFFYGEHESVEYCAKLYKELIAFVNELFQVE